MMLIDFREVFQAVESLRQQVGKTRDSVNLFTGLSLDGDQGDGLPDFADDILDGIEQNLMDLKAAIALEALEEGQLEWSKSE